MKDWKEKLKSEDTTLRAGDGENVSEVTEPTSDSAATAEPPALQAPVKLDSLKTNMPFTGSAKSLATDDPFLLDKSLERDFSRPSKIWPLHDRITCAILLISTVFVALTQISNPATSPYLYSQTIDQFRCDHEHSVAMLTEAIKIHPDPIFYRDRARDYNRLNDRVREAADLETAIKSGLNKDSDSRYALALCQLAGNLGPAQVQETLHKYVKNFGFKDVHKNNRDQDILLQLLSSEPDFVIELNSEQLKDSDSSKVTEAILDKALALRQLGRTAEAKSLVAHLEGRSGDLNHEILPASLLVKLIELDQSKETTIPFVKQNGDQYDYYKVFPNTTKLFSAWVNFQNKKYEDAASLANIVLITQEEQRDDNFGIIQRIAACHRLLELIYRAQGDQAKANVEHRAYLATHCTGSLFIPKPYQVLSTSSH